ncbi:MAG: putative multidrug-efflux transporter [Promethearchaeota archaeon]|nr:MAG: putative multidrug-efflux transporter [Candidatus Lokiarchaeota archaeon]
MGVNPTDKTFKKYLLLLGGQLFSLLGSSVIQFVLIIWITEITRDEVIIALAAFIFFLPLVLLTPIAGVFTDKYDRKKIILISDSGQALITFGLIVVFALGTTNVWLVIFINSFRGICQAFHQPTVNSIIPTMVPKDKLSRVNGINYLMTGVIQVIGPLVAVWFLIFIPLGQIFWIDLLTFSIALIPLLLVDIPSVNGTVKDSLKEKKKNTFKEDFKEGLEVIKGIPGIISLIFLAMLVNFLIQPINTLLSFFILVYHEGSEFNYALMSAFFQAGVVLGGIIASIKKDWPHKILLTVVGIVTFNVGYAFLGFTPRGLFLMLSLFGLMMGFILPIINTIFMTLIQLNVPPEKIGRVHAIDSTVSMAISPLGTLISGPLAKFFGVQNLYIYCGILGVLITVLIWLFTDIRRLDTEPEEQEEEKIPTEKLVKQSIEAKKN